MKGVKIIMRDLKEYKAPKAEITVFECAEDIMTSSTPTYSLKTGVGSASGYVKLDSKSWGDIYDPGQ